MNSSEIVIVLLSLISIVLEGVMFWKIRRNGVRILKYYTLLSNFLFLITSVIVVICGLFRGDFPLLLEGLYLATTLGLTLTMVVYWVIIYPRERKRKDTISQASGISGVSNLASNLVWHTICPLISIICLALLPEVKIGSEWILITVIPTALYGITYAILTLSRRWSEPYGFLTEKQKFSKKGLVLCLGIMALALAIDFGLYQIMGIFG